MNTMKKTLALGCAAALIQASGCGLFPPGACTLEAVFGLNVTLADETGEPITDATLTLRDGGYQETMTELSPGNFAGPSNEPEPMK